MTPADYRAALAALDITTHEVAQMLGVSDRQAYRYASGESDVPPPVARFLTYLVREDVSPERVMAVLEKWRG
jgi:transcriptional regulator with XRE-family HTH domain